MAELSNHWIDPATGIAGGSPIRTWLCTSPSGALLGGQKDDDDHGIIRTRDDSEPDFTVPTSGLFAGEAELFPLPIKFNFCDNRCICRDQYTSVAHRLTKSGATWTMERLREPVAFQSGSWQVIATDISGDGMKAVGWYDNHNGLNNAEVPGFPGEAYPWTRALLWDAGSLTGTDLGVLAPYEFSAASCISGDGNIIGGRLFMPKTPGTVDGHPYRFDTGVAALNVNGSWLLLSELLETASPGIVGTYELRDVLWLSANGKHMLVRAVLPIGEYTNEVRILYVILP